MRNRTRIAAFGLAALAAWPLGSCRIERQSRSTDALRGAPELSLPTGAWQLLRGEELVGWVVLFESSSHPERNFYSVRNAFQQELGLIDRTGRAWRFRPFEEEAEWVSTGRIVDGATSILGAGGACRLEEISLESAGALPGA